MKRIALVVALAAILGTSVAAFAADPCPCGSKDCKQAAAQLTSSKAETRSLHEQEFNQIDLNRRF
ncbi:MAG: hypothetical protein HY900_20155 [Deltaproteobacteria bacterium]|nr:hypothetical protein [Deltaproteobacteria bacterium]